MNKSLSEYQKIISQARWQAPEQFQFTNSYVKQWLMEQSSLTHKLSQHCQTLSVEVVNNAPFQIDNPSSSEAKLLEDTDCWLREVVLYGDNCSWLIGRTLMPTRGMEAGSYNLSRQGNTPLGKTVFANQKPVRDALQLAAISFDGGDFYARRSRLWVEQTPLLVTELFLPNSPIYRSEHN